MYLTALQVKDRRKPEEIGINVFFHEHGPDFPWPEDPTVIPETCPGPIVRRAVEVGPGGNLVLAYLDVIAPDGTPFALLESVTEKYRARLTPEFVLPAALQLDSLAVRFWVQPPLNDRAPQLFDELKSELFHHGARWLSNRQRGVHGA